MKLLEELVAPNKVRPKAGDVFAFRIMARYRFLRIIVDDAILFRQTPALVAYFYSPECDTPEPPLSFDRRKLLIPVQLMTASVLREGFFLRVGNTPIAAEDKWDQHCFKSVMHGKTYEDEYGNDCSEFSPVGYNQVWGAERIDMQIASVLGIDSSAYEWLHELPRPSYRARMAGKLPHSFVILVIPHFSLVAPRLHKLLGPLKGDSLKASYLVQADTLLWKYIRKAGLTSLANFEDLSGLALNAENTPREDTYFGFFTVKKRQHKQLFEAVARVMAELEIDQYWIQDGILHDWLAGSFVPHQPLRLHR